MKESRKIFYLFIIGLGLCFFGFIIGLLGGMAGLAILAFIILLAVTWVVLQKPVVGVYLIAFFLPFERIGGVKFGGVNIRISQIILLITLAVWIFGVLYKKKKIKITTPLIAASIFLLSNLASIFFSIDYSRSLQVFVFTTFCFLLVFLLPNLLIEERDFRTTLYFWLAGGFFAALFGLYQFVGDMIGLPSSVTLVLARYGKEVLGFTRVAATANEPLYFANFLLPLIALLVMAYLRRVKIMKAFYQTVLLIIFSIIFILTFSKGAFAAAAIMILIVLSFQLRFIFRKENLVFLLGIFAFFFVVGATILYSTGQIDNFDKYLTKTIGIITGGTITERVEATSTAIEAFASAPLFGIGPGAYGSFFVGYSFDPTYSMWPIVNNEYLEILAETGLFGLFTFLIFIASLFFAGATAGRARATFFMKYFLISLVIALIGVLIQYLTFSTLYIMQIWFLFAMIVAIASYVNSGRAKGEDDDFVINAS